MAYKQKNNPFKQVAVSNENTNTNPNDIELAQRLNKLRFNMGHIYPITSEEEIKEEREKKFEGQGRQFWDENPDLKQKSIQSDLDRTAQSEEEREELYAQDVTGQGYSQHGNLNPEHIGTTSHGAYESEEAYNKEIYSEDLRFIKTAREAGGDVFNKIMSMSEKDIANFERDIIDVAQPFRGKNLGDDPVATLKELRNLDLTKFKPYLKKSGLTVDNINKVITSQLNNQPDLNEDGTPDAFEGLTGKVLKSGIDYLVSSKLKDLE